jgi:hypothetical protein
MSSQPHLDEALLDNTMQRVSDLDAPARRQLRGQLGDADVPEYLDQFADHIDALEDLSQKLNQPIMKVHSFVRRILFLACNANESKLSVEAACKDFKESVQNFECPSKEALELLKEALANNSQVRKELKGKKSTVECQHVAARATGVCCMSIGAKAIVPLCFLGVLQSSSAAAWFPWLVKHTSQHIPATWWQNLLHLAPTPGYVLQNAAIEHESGVGFVGCLGGISTILGSPKIFKEKSSSIQDALAKLEKVRRALEFLKEEWHGVDITCTMLIDYFSSPDPQSLKMLCAECAPKLVAAVDTVDKFLVVLSLSKNIPSNLHDSIPNLVGEQRFNSLSLAMRPRRV